MERGDTGLGRDAYGLPRRRRLGDRRAYRRDDGPGPNGPDGAEDDEYGRGLAMVNTLADEWGWHWCNPFGKLVYARLKLSQTVVVHA